MGKAKLTFLTLKKYPCPQRGNLIHRTLSPEDSHGIAKPHMCYRDCLELACWCENWEQITRQLEELEGER